jgi:glycosyltransferase involved in cell wall biosynthesis
VTAVHQFLPTLEPGAVGAHAVEVRRTMHDVGVESELFADDRRGGLPVDAHDFEAYGASFPAHRDDVLLYHCAVGSRVARFVASRTERLVVDYHNITPAEHFDAWEPDLGVNLSLGSDQLAGLAGRAVAGMADSRFNADELVALGYPNVSVVPILLDVNRLVRRDTPALGTSAHTAHWPAGTGTRWLFVGRIAPNKAQHDIVKAFACYRTVHDPNAALTLVGGTSAPAYATALHRYVDTLGLTDHVRLAGSVPDDELEALYRSAHTFVCLSEHEGFCVPLLEAMAHDLPIVAYAAAAVPETLGDAGILLDSKRPALVAEAVHRTTTDTTLRRHLVTAGHHRLTHYDLTHTRQQLLDTLTPLLP